MQIKITYPSFAWSETHGYYRGETLGEILVDAVSKSPFLKGELISLNFWVEESEIKEDENCSNDKVVNVLKLQGANEKTIQHIQLPREPFRREQMLQALANDRLVEQIQMKNDRTAMIVLGTN